MRIGQTKLAWMLCSLGIAAALLLLPGTACNLFQKQAPAGLMLDPNSIGLIIINESGVPVRADAVYRQGTFEVRRTTRFLADSGQTATSEVIPTLADSLSIEAFEADPSKVARVGDPIASATLVIGKDFNAGDTVTFIIRKSGITTNVTHPPVGEPIPEITVASGAPVTIDVGGAFSDPDGLPLTVTWAQVTGPNIALSTTNGPIVHFTAPVVPPNQTLALSFQVTATDPNDLSTQITVHVLVVGPLPISITPSAAQIIAVNRGTTVSAQISGGVAPYTIAWSVQSSPTGHPGSFGSASQASTSWSPPAHELGTWVLLISVADSQGNHQSATVNVTVGADCNTNGTPDSQETSAAADCNTNNILDVCELAVGALHDCDHNGVIDECDPNGAPDCPVIYCNPANGDCNTNGIWDACDILLGTSRDFNGNGTPDECEDKGSGG